jgi:hypothetical protein
MYLPTQDTVIMQTRYLQLLTVRARCVVCAWAGHSWFMRRAEGDTALASADGQSSSLRLGSTLARSSCLLSTTHDVKQRSLRSICNLMSS